MWSNMKSLRVLALLALTAAAGSAQTPTIWVIGDSTASNANRRGWADPFADYFDQTRAHTVNRARAGRSSRTFLTEGLWEKVRAELKPGDYVLIQFGHNDGGPPDKDRARGSLPALGDEEKEFTMPDGRKEMVRTFGWYMRKFVADTRAKGAHPMILSLTVRNIWKDGKVERGSGQFSQWSEAVARAEHVPFVDVTNAVADQYEKLGEEKVKELFSTDHTHTSPAGAEMNAAAVVAGLKGIASPLTKFLSAKGDAIAPYPEPARTSGGPPVLHPSNPA